MWNGTATDKTKLKLLQEINLKRECWSFRSGLNVLFDVFQINSLRPSDAYMRL